MRARLARPNENMAQQLFVVKLFVSLSKRLTLYRLTQCCFGTEQTVNPIESTGNSRTFNKYSVFGIFRGDTHMQEISSPIEEN